MMNQTPEKIWAEYEQGMGYNQQLDLYECVKNNENFFIGKQWEGVQSNGLPTPVFNFIKRIVLFLVASTATDNLKLNASGMGGADVQNACRMVNDQFEAVGEENKLGKLLRELMRNAAVDGDGCLYTWYDPDAMDGKGGIRTEVLENTRVHFGNPSLREVERQPYLILVRRERLEDVRNRAARYGGDVEAICADDNMEEHEPGSRAGDGKVTVLVKLWRGKTPQSADADSSPFRGAKWSGASGTTGDGGRGGETIWACEVTRNAVVRAPWDTCQKRYPIVWLPWDYVQDSYHGHAAVTGLIPNQVFVNKLFAMTMISLMTTAYPKVVYDKTRVARWDSRVGAAIGVNGGDVNNVARTIDPATISPQVSQFIEMAVQFTKEFSGATDAALGNVRPDNTSAIIALQKASSVPMELVKQNFYQCIEDLGRVWMDLMRVYYGVRRVMGTGERPDEGIGPYKGEGKPGTFDFGTLEGLDLSLKLDVGASAYWSEIAQMNTLDNLLVQGKISVVDYLERVPNGYITDQQKLIDTLREREGAKTAPAAGGMPGMPSMGGMPGMPGMGGMSLGSV